MFNQSKKITLSDCQRFAKSINGECLSDVYSYRLITMEMQNGS
jgi:hypothetical protein